MSTVTNEKACAVDGLCVDVWGVKDIDSILACCPLCEFGCNKRLMVLLLKNLSISQGEEHRD